MKDTRKGFTLVELLAVIVILAIIMIIAIPSVLSTMNTARQKSFIEYVTKVYNQAQQIYMKGGMDANEVAGTKIKSANFDGTDGTGGYIYDITKDLGFDSVGSYTGYVVALSHLDAKTNRDTISYYVALTDGNYGTRSKGQVTIGTTTTYTRWWNYSDDGEPSTADISNASAFTESFGGISSGSVTQGDSTSTTSVDPQAVSITLA